MESSPEQQEIYLGFAAKPKKGNFDIVNFPHKIGGLPVFIIPQVESILSTSFCAVPAFILVEPDMASAPVSAQIKIYR